MYGPSCNQSCACVVANTVSCDSVTGACSCQTAWEGSTCSVDVNECNSGDVCPDGNDACLNEAGGFRCDCNAGFVRDGAGVCQGERILFTVAAMTSFFRYLMFAGECEATEQFSTLNRETREFTNKSIAMKHAISEGS